MIKHLLVFIYLFFVAQSFAADRDQGNAGQAPTYPQVPYYSADGGWYPQAEYSQGQWVPYYWLPTPAMNLGHGPLLHQQTQNTLPSFEAPPPSELLEPSANFTQLAGPKRKTKQYDGDKAKLFRKEFKKLVEANKVLERWDVLKAVDDKIWAKAVSRKQNINWEKQHPVGVGKLDSKSQFIKDKVQAGQVCVSFDEEDHYPTFIILLDDHENEEDEKRDAQSLRKNFASTTIQPNFAGYNASRRYGGVISKELSALILLPFPEEKESSNTTTSNIASGSEQSHDGKIKKGKRRSAPAKSRKSRGKQRPREENDEENNFVMNEEIIEFENAGSLIKFAKERKTMTTNMMNADFVEAYPMCDPARVYTMRPTEAKSCEDLEMNIHLRHAHANSVKSSFFDIVYIYFVDTEDDGEITAVEEVIQGDSIHFISWKVPELAPGNYAVAVQLFQMAANGKTKISMYYCDQAFLLKGNTAETFDMTNLKSSLGGGGGGSNPSADSNFAGTNPFSPDPGDWYWPSNHDVFGLSGQ